MVDDVGVEISILEDVGLVVVVYELVLYSIRDLSVHRITHPSTPSFRPMGFS
jgi:hypothetical protein